MIIIADFIDYVKDGVHFITGDDEVFCPVCHQLMKKCGRCRRYARGKYGKRDELAVRVLYCRNCKHHHRELPDFVVPHKHFGAEVFAAVCDALGNYFIDDHSASRMLRWVKAFFKLGLATVRRLKLEHPTLVTKYNADSTLDTLRYFVMLVVNAGEWRSTSLRILSG